ncbi:MAG: DUF3105 domain-containing protein [Solirubrobacterales bacterium]|nr:DUF3105 domain-containing protein [Solirubrobacterales bacterium]
MSVWLERAAIVIASLILSIGLIALLSGFFAGRDQAGVSGTGNVPGQQFQDLGHAQLHPGQQRPAYNSNPPTSGAHIPAPITSDESQLSNDQILQALESGDVVILYGTATPPPGLGELARSLGRFTPPLAGAGQAVVLGRRSTVSGLIALAWARMLRVQSVRDPALQQFVQQTLGRGAPGR